MPLSTHGCGMTEPGGPSRILSALLPGMPQLLTSSKAPARRASGLIALGVWLGMVLVVVTRPSRLLSAVGGAWDDRLAVLTVVVSMVTVWVWSWKHRAAIDPGAEVGVSQWALAGRTFSRNRTAVAGLAIVIAMYLVALLAPIITPHDPYQRYDLLTEGLVSMSAKFPLGTDFLARDVLSRLLYGARISLSIGFVAVGISVTLGTVLGATAGYLGGWVDGLIMRFVDMVISIPRLVLVITAIALLDASIFLIVAILGLTLWPSTARIVRGEVLSLREREFVQAAEALGYSRRRILLRHLVPNALGPVIVAATLGMGNTIVLEAGLSFLGLGVDAPTPSWGTMVADGQEDLLNAWWLSTFPGLAIVLTVLAFNLVGDGLRDALDPRLRR